MNGYASHTQINKVWETKTGWEMISGMNVGKPVNVELSA
jgi:hypothetical protein